MHARVWLQYVFHVAGMAAGVRGANRYTATVNQLAARNVSFATTLSLLTTPPAAEVTVRVCCVGGGHCCAS